MRFACDTGGTFTDLVVEHDDGSWSMFKAETVPGDPPAGVLAVLAKAAEAAQAPLDEYLAVADSFIHGTTHAINAVITGSTAKTALLTTQGHKDILYFREGGRLEPFNHTVPYPAPYVPRRLTYEVPGRIDCAGAVLIALDEAAVLDIIESLKAQHIEAVAVCLIWSISNNAHETRVAELLAEHLPGVPVSISHQLNPVIREFRRASSTAIDASLKPTMSRYLNDLTGRLRQAGFDGRVLMLTSQGGMMDIDDVAEAPIRVINSGPSTAPLAGDFFASRASTLKNTIVADTGGTTYDVSLVRQGRIPFAREMWIGRPFIGHMAGFPSVDVKSVGAGGGSIAWIDAGGVLHVGPQSAGADPGPACYQRGGDRATVTDASMVLGYIDPDFFLGGEMALDTDASSAVIQRDVADPMNVSLEEAASAIITIATENMVRAIEEITVNQGIDPSQAILIGGGGAAGLNSVLIARRLGCPELLIPEAGPVMSATGALISDLRNEYRQLFFTTLQSFDLAGANAALGTLETQCQAFIDGPGAAAIDSSIEYRVEARYKNQVWDIEVPLPFSRFNGKADIEAFADIFHQEHLSLFAVNDPDSDIEIVSWLATVRCPLRASSAGRMRFAATRRGKQNLRSIFFDELGRVDAPVFQFGEMKLNQRVKGPAIIENEFTTVVINPGAGARMNGDGNLAITPWGESGI